MHLSVLAILASQFSAKCHFFGGHIRLIVEGKSASQFSWGTKCGVDSSHAVSELTSMDSQPAVRVSP